MNLRSFTDELCRLGDGRRALVKVAAGGLYTRMGSIGAASGLGALGLQKAKHMLTGDPYDEPIDTVTSATVKGGLGGLSVAGLLHLLAKATKKVP
jgi:hypothetical protein